MVVKPSDWEPANLVAEPLLALRAARSDGAGPRHEDSAEEAALVSAVEGRRALHGRDLVLGLDLGTSEAKAGLFDLSGNPAGVARRAYPTHGDGQGRAEQDPSDWWHALVACVRQLAPDPRSVASIAAVGHGPTLALLRADGTAVRPAITWRDRRIPRSGGFGLLPHLRWLAENDRESLPAVRWWFPTWDAISFWLTGIAVHSLQRHERPIEPDTLLSAGVDPRLMPPPVPMGTPIGGLATTAAAELGLRSGTPVVAGANDGTASLLGSGLLAPGEAVDTGGSSGGFAVYWDRPLGIEGVFEAPAPVPGLYVLGGAMSATGAAFGWLRERVLRGGPSFGELVAEAASAEPGAGGLIFLPYLAGERAPVFDDAARGAFVGLTAGHGRAQLARAVLEAPGFAIRHVAGAILAAGVTVTEMRIAERDDSGVSGGTRRRGGPRGCGVAGVRGPTEGRPGGIRAQIKADTTGFPVAILRVSDTAALGSAILAASGAGLAPSLAEAVRSMPAVEGRIEPDPAVRARYDELFEVYRGLYPALRPFEPARPRAADPVGTRVRRSRVRPSRVRRPRNQAC